MVIAELEQIKTRVSDLETKVAELIEVAKGKNIDLEPALKAPPAK